MPDPSVTDWAYAAGFVDGEGCIAITRSFIKARDKYSYSVAVVAANRERGVLDWMQAFWGGWVVQVKLASGNQRPAWHWRSPTGTTAQLFLEGIRPWLRIKNEQCENALSMIEILKRSRYTLGRRFLPVEWLRLQEEHYWKQRRLNHRGNESFEARPMHSPRKIKRERAQAMDTIGDIINIIR
ncbi:MAG: hypothetical protein E6J40_08545 [Chloroflexi bacterium]|nr:MAG: hypothetical protein E6J40_08545 [Chloroflexota bacterium]